MDIDNNSLSFYNLKKYEDHLNNSNKDVKNIKSKQCNGNKKKLKEKNNINVNDIPCQNHISNSNQSFVSFSDDSSYLSSFYNNDIFDENSDHINGHGKLINNIPCNSDDSDNSLSEYACYKEQKKNYINNILNDNKCKCYENGDYSQHIKTPEKKKHTAKSLEEKNRKNSFNFNNNHNATPITQKTYKNINITKNINSAKENDVENQKSLYDKENNNYNVDKSIINNRNDCHDNNNSESNNNEEDLYSVISGSEYDNKTNDIHKINVCDNSNSIDNVTEKKTSKIEEITVKSNNVNSMKENKFTDEMEYLMNNKKMKNIQKNVLKNFDSNKDKIKDTDFIIKNNYEFKELIASTINMCYPKIKNGNDSHDILRNMEKLSKIVISDDKNKEILNNDEEENTNSLYDEVDNILDKRNKMYIEEKCKLLLKKKDVINKDNLDNKKIEKDLNKGSENLDSSQMKSEKIKGITENKEKENNNNNNNKLDNFIYYLNHNMIELNDNICKLYNSTCDITQRNYCTKNIINIVPQLNNIYENKNLCYIKDTPNFNEISKIIPEWKDSFELLNKKALKDTEDMKNILHRIENIRNDLDELNKDLKEDKKEFEKIKFETVEHESMISSFEKKSKIHIKGVLKLDNMSYKLKKIHNISSNNLNNFTISEHVNRLLKCIDNSLIDYSQNFNEKNFEILRFQNLDNKFDILTNTDEESCFVMNILNEELKEMILEKKEKLQKIIRKTQLYNILDTNTYKEHIGNTLSKHNILINQIKNNLQNKVILLFDMYERFFKKNMKIIKISDIHVKDYINENIKKSYIIKTFNDTKKNVEKYFMSINFTRNKPIDHPFFIYHCLSEKFVYNFITFVLDPLSEQNQKNFMQYCSIPGFNSFLFSQQVIKLYRQEEQFTKSDISYDFSSAYSRIMCSDLYDFSHKNLLNNVKEKWNDENQYLISLRNASDNFFKSFISKNNYNSYFTSNSSNGFNLIQHIPDSLTHMCNNYTAICYDNFNNQGAVLGIAKNEDVNKLNLLSSYLHSSTSNTNNNTQNNNTANNLFNINKSNIFTNNSPNNLFNNNSITNNNILNNTSNIFGNNNSSNLFGNSNSSNLFAKNPSENATNNIFINTANNLFKNINKTDNLLNNNTNNLFDQSKSNIFINNPSNNLFKTNDTTTNNTLNSTTNLFGINNSSNNIFTKNLNSNSANNLFGNSTNNMNINNSNKNNLFNNNITSNISNSLQNNNTPISNNNLYNKSCTTNFFSGSNNNTSGFFNKNSLNVSNNLFNNDKTTTNMNSNIFSSSSLQTNVKPNNFTNNSIFSTNINNNNSSLSNNGMFSSTLRGNQFMNNNSILSTNDLNRQSNNIFYTNNSNNNSMNINNVNSSIYDAKYNCDNLNRSNYIGINSYNNNNNNSNNLFNNNNSNNLFNNNNSNNLFNNNSIFNNQSNIFSVNNNSNSLLNNNNSFSLNRNANIFSNNTLSSSNTNNLSKNNLFNISSNNLSNNSNNIFSNNNNNNNNNNLFNNANNISTNNLFNNNLGVTSNSINNNLSYNNNSLFNQKNNLLISNNNNNINTNTSMLNNSSIFSSNNNLLQNNNFSTTSLDNKSTSLFSKDNKTTNNIFDNRLFQNQNNNYISNSKIDISGKNTFGITANLSNNLFQKNSFSTTQNKGEISNFNSSSLSNNFNVLNNINPFQKNNESNFPSFYNSTNNTLFSR